MVCDFHCLTHKNEITNFHQKEHWRNVGLVMKVSNWLLGFEPSLTPTDSYAHPRAKHPKIQHSSSGSDINQSLKIGT
jgi:hypothetical protein